ncbi:MAG: hypothetical protein ACR2PK_01230, partial [Acidimicrobiales bacterium]
MADPTEVLNSVRELAESWRADRPSRQLRRSLDPGDFELLKSTGFPQMAVPTQDGGNWEEVGTTARAVCEMLRTLSRADPSVALVSSMHPAVIAFWLLNPTDDPEWMRQRQSVFETAVAGNQWGTITSEPGSGGDISRTLTRATLIEATSELPGSSYALTGTKHFGSGSGITSYMITTALVAETDEPAGFILDVRDRPWEAGAGMSLVAEWDGMGMAATQSHAMSLDDMPATRFAWDRSLDELALDVAPFASCLFTAVILGILDEAVSEARTVIAERATTLRAYEQTEWTQAEMDHWLAVQAYEGGLRALESGDRPLYACSRTKQSVAGLAESVLGRLTR